MEINETVQTQEKENARRAEAPAKAEKEDLAEEIDSVESEKKRREAEKDFETEVDKYKREIEELKRKLEEDARINREKSLFKELFPDVDAGDIPEEVFKNAEKSSLPLAAEYAFYLRRSQLKAAKELKNAAENAGSQCGAVDSYGERENYFTIERIRSMTPAEVGRNYKAVIRSITKIKNYR